jgi:hypothetical protein
MFWYTRTPAGEFVYSDDELAVAGDDPRRHVLNRGADGAGGLKQVAMTDLTVAACWDGLAPNVTLRVGDWPAGGIPFMGWPQTDVPPAATTPP